MTTKNPTPPDLAEAMALFEQTTSKLRASYESLQGQMRELTGKLEESRAERDRLADYLEHLVESVPSGVIAVDPQGVVTMLNPAARRITGLGDDVVGRGLAEVFPIAEPESTGTMEFAPTPTEMDIERGGGDRQVLTISESPFTGEGGALLGRVVVFQEITRLKRLEEQHARNARLVAMGEMAAGLAHEIRNPLGSLELFSSHLVDELRGSEWEELADQILKGIRNLSGITGNLLVYARKVSVREGEVRLAELAGEVLLYAAGAAKAKNITVDSEVIDVTTVGDGELLRQALLNLTLNSVQAAGEGGRVRVSVQKTETDERPVVLIGVEDDGPGVPATDRERIFDPFFTTKSRGVGLGLAIVQRIVSAHGGAVSVGESTLGGASFTVELPLGADQEGAG